jgi:hypothetical protein
MALKLDNLVAKQAIVEPRSGFPTGQFMLLWQRQSKELERADKALADQLALIQQQQEVIAQLLGVVAQNVIYLEQVADYQQQQAIAIIQRNAYTQCAAGTIASATGTDISGCGDPSDFPPWPTPPTPPFA